MPRVGRQLKRIVWVASACLASAILLASFLILGTKTTLNDTIFLVFIISILPPTALDFVDQRWKRAVDEQLPEVFRAIVQAQETGMTLPQALEEISKRDYGPLTDELRKMTSQISWGMTFQEALLSLERRVNTALLRRTTPMIIEASRSGGRVEKVFDPLSRFIRSTILFERDRRNQTKPYIAIIYVAFFVFLFTITMLFKSFFTSIESLPTVWSAVTSPTEIHQIFVHMTIIQAFFGGVVAGKIGEATIKAGLKHSIVLMFSGYVTLKLFL